MSVASSVESEKSLPVPAAEWVARIPEGAVSIETDGIHWSLRASTSLQTRFEQLLDHRKSGTLTAEESLEYEAICDLDSLLSGFNRLARSIGQGR